MITYQEIYDILRKEKYNEALQELPREFFKELAEYIADKRKLLSRESDSTLFSDTLRMTRKQLDNALSVIKELLAIRERKVLNLAFAAAQTGVTKRDTDNLLEHERDLFEISVKKLEENQKLIKKRLEGVEQGEGKDLKNLFIKFKQDIPAFLGPDGQEFGPFKEGEIANLAKEIVDILISDGKAMVIDDTD
jgi:DNA replication initiation complex subunit (GINS family)